MINLLIVLFGVSMLYMASSSRVMAMINMLKLQGIILCLVTLITNHNANIAGIAFLLLETRSEERRVGKECRSRWSPYH